MTRIFHFTTATLLACGIALIPARGGANPQYVKGQNKGQKKTATHDMTGCLEKGTEANTYKLTSIEGKGPKSAEIVPASGVDLAPHVGHKVRITGQAMTAKEATKAEGETATGAKGAVNKSKEAAEHHMRASAVNMISTTCK